MILANEGIASFSFSCNYDVSVTVEANEPIKVTFEEGSGSYIQEGHLADSLGSYELNSYNFKITYFITFKKIYDFLKINPEEACRSVIIQIPVLILKWMMSTKLALKFLLVSNGQLSLSSGN